MPLPSPAEAERIVLAHVPTLPAEDQPLERAHGRVLRAPVAADRDLPPFDRVTMDGYALRAAACAAGRRTFRIAGLQTAGQPPLALEDDDACIEIMTGAALPAGADAIVPYEETDAADGRMTLRAEAVVSTGANLHRRGSDAPAGSVVLPAGLRLGGREIAAAAACGRAVLSVARLPKVAIVATGGELVEVGHPAPAPHQIRRSNDHALRATLLAARAAETVDRFHLPDDREAIARLLRDLLDSHDVLLLTGGVSKGRTDHVPAVLAELGVTTHVAGVAQRPGKPFRFGVAPGGRPVFALPGNPVSACTCLQRYVLPALARMSGEAEARPEFVALAAPVALKPDLAWLPPVIVTSPPDGRRTAAVVALNTSGDLAGLVGTDGFVELPPGPGTLPAGAAVRFRPWS